MHRSEHCHKPHVSALRSTHPLDHPTCPQPTEIPALPNRKRSGVGGQGGVVDRQRRETNQAWPSPREGRLAPPVLRIPPAVCSRQIPRKRKRSRTGFSWLGGRLQNPDHRDKPRVDTHPDRVPRPRVLSPASLLRSCHSLGLIAKEPAVRAGPVPSLLFIKSAQRTQHDSHDASVCNHCATLRRHSK